LNRSSDTETRLVYRYPTQTLVGQKDLCVVVKVLPGDAFVITAYLIDNVKKERVLWPTAV
jgi:arginine repressor